MGERQEILDRAVKLAWESLETSWGPCYPLQDTSEHALNWLTNNPTWLPKIYAEFNRLTAR